jgi:hypothetical protein
MSRRLQTLLAWRTRPPPSQNAPSHVVDLSRELVCFTHHTLVYDLDVIEFPTMTAKPPVDVIASSAGVLG